LPVSPSSGLGNPTVEAAQAEVFRKVLAENYIRSLGRSFNGFAQAIRDYALFLFPFYSLVGTLGKALRPLVLERDAEIKMKIN